MPLISPRIRVFAAALSVSACALISTHAANVWLDFGAAWVTELDAATTSAGVTNFSPAERATIESNIESDFNTVYSAYQLTFTAAAVDPGGTRERVNFGAVTGGGGFGSAPLDFGNASTGTQSVFTANFDTFIESGDPRATQIAEISASLAGTGAHELLHSLGARHHTVYSATGITPANYASTGGLQNQHIMATGSTGLNETERETLRTLSPWSQVILDVAGGTSFGGIAVTNTPVATAFEAGDAGGAYTSAQFLSTAIGETSGQSIGLVRGDLDVDGADVDYYSFSVNGPTTISAELWSIDRFSADFDGSLTLYALDGVTPLFTNNDVLYSGDTYNAGTLRELDPMLVNIPVFAAGTYFLEIEATTPGAETAGDDYILLLGFDNPVVIPEPTRVLLGLLGFAGFAFRRRRS